jgi:Kef-type K+ transport system membrane component KefB
MLGMREPQNIQGLARRRVLVGTGAGIVTLAIALLVGASWSVSVLVGWDTVTLVFLGWVWATITLRLADDREQGDEPEGAGR